MPVLFLLLCTVLAGCVFKPVNVTTRHFLLTPIATGEARPVATSDISVGIGSIRMPAYLLRDSLLIRYGTNEIEYLDSSLWAERLDHCFQQTVAANLSTLLASDRIYTTDWARDQVAVSVYINVQQFDVDATGSGTLVAQWRINTPGNNRTLKSGNTILVQSGCSPKGHPAAIAATLSGLTEKFSRQLAEAIVETGKPAG